MIRNIVTLELKAHTIPGSTWGCVACDLPSEGACAILCDRCAQTSAHIRFAVDGYLADRKRIPIEELHGKHEHDLRRHPEYMAHPQIPE